MSHHRRARQRDARHWPLVRVCAGLVPTAALVVFAGVASAAPADYPTEALADYVFGCMATNGETPEALRRCSCSIDKIAARLPWDDYVKASTVAAMQAGAGDVRLQMFKGSPWAKAMIDKLRQAQAEAELSCF